MITSLMFVPLRWESACQNAHLALVKELCARIYDRITKEAEHLVSTGEDIEREFGIPIINKRISVTPISLVAGGSDLTSYVPVAEAMDRAAKAVGVNFIGGFSALVTKGATRADRILIDSIPEALATTDIVCSSVAVGSTKTGINMDAVRDMGIIVKKTAELTRIMMLLAVLSSLFSVILQKIIHLWQVLSSA